MHNYQFLKGITGSVGVVFIASIGTSIPLVSDNTDYQQFLKDWEAGAEVLNADGSPATYSDDAVRALGLEP